MASGALALKVLVIGSGGREHTLAWKIAQDPRVERVYAAPGSDGMAAVAESTGIGVGDLEALADFAAAQEIALTVVGPEAPLAAGIVDLFRERGLRIFGPDREGAQLESSKAFTKEILAEAGVPTAAYETFTEVEPAREFARHLGAPLVVKADGLAAGKGVVICATVEEADSAIESMLRDGRFGEASRRIVIEEFLDGEEASFMALTDGKHVLALASSQDHKAAFDGDKGPNTGGMGAYSPAPVISDERYSEVIETVIEPTVAALARRGIDYRGVLYAGLMIHEGRAKVLEYNVRFGDPECQPIMVRLRSSLVDLIEAAIDGRLGEVSAEWDEGSAVCVVMASGGYPGDYSKGEVITGIEQAAGLEGVEVFHAGTKRDEQGRWLSSGGRVLGVTATGADVREAVERAYGAVGAIDWNDVHYRGDIGHRAVAREKEAS